MRRNIGVWQMAPTPADPRANLGRLRAVAREANAAGADLLVAPELALTGYDIGPLDGDLTHPRLRHAVARIAAETGVALVVGAALTEDGRTWNAALLVDRDGTCRATYRKAHLFGDLDRDRFSAGDQPFTLASLAGIRVATMICYDIEFPEAARAAALAGADLIAVPTANMVPWGVVNDVLVRARAVENQVHLAYANHCGTEGGSRYVGRSVLAGPDGSAQIAGEGEELLLGTLDLDQLARSRAATTYLADRRPALYTALASPTPAPPTTDPTKDPTTDPPTPDSPTRGACP